MLVECAHCRSVIEQACQECPWCLAPRQNGDERAGGRFQIRLWVLLLVTAGLGCWLGLTLQTIPKDGKPRGPASVLERNDATGRGQP